MQVMLRDRGLPELTESLRGKRVLIWTCNTCARMCDIGGTSNADRLAGELRSGGIEVTGVISVGASCVFSSIEPVSEDPAFDCDIVLALTCDIGAKAVGEVSGKTVLNPVRTFGTGFRGHDRMPVLMGRGGAPDIKLGDLAIGNGLPLGPF